jgi:outer membrane protein TolC
MATVMARIFFAALLPCVVIGGTRSWAADVTRFSPEDLKRNSAAVTEVVRRQIVEQPTERDNTRIAMIGDLLKRRPDIGGARTLEPVDRRSAIAGGLGNNLTIAIGLTSPERTTALADEASAVFLPVLDLTIGYGRNDAEHRTRIGMAITKAVNADGFNMNSPFKNLPPAENAGQAVITDMKLRPVKGGKLIELPIEATSGREFGAPKESLNYSLSISQELPWGGTFTITDRTVQREIYYRGGYHWEEGQWSTGLSGTLNMPLPFTKGFGAGNDKLAASRSAAAVAERADWDLQALLNKVLLDIDTAYFDVVRRMEALETTVGNRDMIGKQKERMDRLYGLRQVTRLQKAQVDAEAGKAEVRVEQALSEYVASSQALSLLIGDSSVVGGAAIYLPVDYADDLAQAVPVSFEDALVTAQATRPDFKINDINALLREIAEAQARTNARPDLRISASATSSQAGTTYGYADPLTSHTKVATPDKIDQNYGLTFTMPWANRAANADADKAELGVKDQEYATTSLQNRVRREITERLAAVQAARSRLKSATAEADNMAAAVASLERQQTLAGTASEDELIQATRQLLSARLSLTGARVDAKQAESGLLYAQGTIAGALASQTASSQLDRNRIGMLSDAGFLNFFKQHSGSGNQPQEKP